MDYVLVISIYSRYFLGEGGETYLCWFVMINISVSIFEL